MLTNEKITEQITKILQINATVKERDFKITI